MSKLINSGSVRADQQQANHDRIRAFLVDIVAACNKHNIAIYGDEDEYGNEGLIAMERVKEDGSKVQLGSLIAVEPGDQDDLDSCINSVSWMFKKNITD